MNRLNLETSPYLQQHKDNPVDWWPYSEEAFEEAKKQDKPIFLSIGYSTCHWCHVMARESFSDPETATFVNNNFINIKMDREEYPGIDKGYQEMFQLLNRRGGGWPLSVWANPDGSPFYIGTYFPKKASFGMPSFMDVNKRIVEAWKTEKEVIDNTATQLVRGLRSLGEHMYQNPGKLNDELYVNEVMGLQSRLDGKYGGIGGAPKFPRISALRFLLQESQIKNQADLLSFVQFTFYKMAQGGIYDQLGGGFARYSVDAKWLVPHFEKMLYDNAGLIHLGAELFAITQDPFIEFVVRDTIAWLAREMRSKSGTFYSAINAESEGREGKFYVWTQKELENILGNDFPIAQLRFGITAKGNFTDPHHEEIKGMNVLFIDKSIEEISNTLKISEDDVVHKLNEIRQILFKTRNKRIPPSTDTKIITSWNAMAIKSLFIAAENLLFNSAGDLAKHALDNLLDLMFDGKMLARTYHEVNDQMIERKIEGVLDDYSFLIGTLIQAFEYTDHWNYISIAKQILTLADQRFFDQSVEMYFLNASSETTLMNRIVQVSDDSMQSGVSQMVSNLFKLGKYLNDKNLVERGQRLAEKFVGRINEFPGAMDSLFLAATPYLRYPTEIMILNCTSDLKIAHHQSYLPNRLIYRWNDENKNDGRPQWEVLENRMEFKDETVLICRGMTCSLPLENVDLIKKELNSSQ